VPATQEDVRRLAQGFRAALLRIPPAERRISLQQFPHGACSDASLLLGQYLADNRSGIWLFRSGVRSEPFFTHAWLELNGLVVDITADQFDDIREEIVLTRDRGWYAHWQPVVGDGQPAVLGYEPDYSSDDDEYELVGPSLPDTYRRIVQQVRRLAAREP
jgi:hypothetical protein